MRLTAHVASSTIGHGLSRSAVKLLVVDDHTVFVETVAASTVADALAVLAGRFDAALVDHDLPDGKGTEVVRALRRAGFLGTIVAISALADGNAALVSAGADRVCAKGAFARIRAVLAGA